MRLYFLLYCFTGNSRKNKAENMARFATQPVTVDELEEAKRLNENNVDENALGILLLIFIFCICFMIN